MKKFILLLTFIWSTVISFAQSTPPPVTRSSTSITQVDPYLSVIKRFGIPTAASDVIDATATSQNTVKLLYNTTLGKLRAYNPLTLTWADATPVDLSNYYTKPQIDSLLGSASSGNIYTTNDTATAFQRTATFQRIKFITDEFRVESDSGIQLISIGEGIGEQVYIKGLANDYATATGVLIEGLGGSTGISMNGQSDYSGDAGSSPGISLYGSARSGTGIFIQGLSDPLPDSIAEGNLNEGVILRGTGNAFANADIAIIPATHRLRIDSINVSENVLQVLGRADDSLLYWTDLSAIGARSEGFNSFQFSDGDGGFYEVNDTIVDDGDSLFFSVGLGTGIGCVMIGAGNDGAGIASVLIGVGNVSADTSALCLVAGFQNIVAANSCIVYGQLNASFGDFSTLLGGENVSHAPASTLIGYNNRSIAGYSTAIGLNNVSNANVSMVIGQGNESNSQYSLTGGAYAIVAADDPNDIDGEDVLFAMGNGTGTESRSNAITLNRNGNLTTTGAIANTAYFVNTAGGSDTIPDNVTTYIYDPDSLQTSSTISLPENPIDGQIQVIAFGGTVTTGTVVASLTVNALGGQGLNVGTSISIGLVEQPFTLQYIGALNRWYLIGR